jgi:CHAT domain-containing protein/tetratricopeptide (TPR) repeat protein
VARGNLAWGIAAGLLCWLALVGAAHAQGADDLARLREDVSRLYSQGRYTEALPIAERYVALARQKHGDAHAEFASALGWQASVFRGLGRAAEAEALNRRSVAVAEEALGPEHPDVATWLNNLAGTYEDQGRYAEAEPLYKRSLAIWEKALGPEHPLVGTALNNLAKLYNALGRYAEAEPLYKRSLAVREKALGPEHRAVGLALSNLAALYQVQGRYAEAEPLYKRSLAVWEKALGPEHPLVGTALNNLALLYQRQGRYTEAEPLFKRSLAVWEKAVGPEHPDVGTALNNLADLYRVRGSYVEAEPLYKRSLAVWEKALGPGHPLVGNSHNNLALLYQVQGRYAEAEPLYKRSLAIREKALGPEHPDVGMTLNNLAWLAYVQSDWVHAADYWRRGTGVIRRRAERGLTRGRGEVSGGEAQRLAWQFWGLVKTTYRLAALGQSPSAKLAAETFEETQWAQGSEAAASLAQMAARSAKGSPQLAALVRERQDLVGEWQAKDKLLIAAKSEEPAKRKAEVERALGQRLSAIDTRLAEIDRQLARDFPDYAALATPAPVSVADVQAQLSADEALVLFLDTPEEKPLPEEAFIWVVTKTDTRWVRSDLGTAALTREVAALRCGLDRTAWYGDGAENCAKALGIPLSKLPSPKQPLPFDHGRAHKLYTALFGEVGDLVDGKHLLIVPSGSLTQLPFQVLVTKSPTSSEHREIAWLARKHAITVLPAVSSLKALRRVGKPSAATRPMIGFGNPLLDGPGGPDADLAKRAREYKRCREAPRQQVAALDGPLGGVAGVEMRGGLVNVSHIKMQVPLPETADELCAVAQDVKAEPRDIHLGAQATEREIKQLSASGELANYRMIHFATHGVLAGQLDDTHEPGLILTPPEKASEEDDGYLSASEIAALKLDADWVILSACNTAAGAVTSAEALSGLARAFIYAQARALLVSHWEVYSDATVKLITVSARETARDPKVGRAEALRRSMLALIDKGAPYEAHPAYWAPFVVVGEGAAVR